MVLWQSLQILLCLFPENVQVPDIPEGSQGPVKSLQVRAQLLRVKIGFKDLRCRLHAPDRNPHVVQFFDIFPFTGPFFMGQHLVKLVGKYSVGNFSHGISGFDSKLFGGFAFFLFFRFCFFLSYFFSFLLYFFSFLLYFFPFLSGFFFFLLYFFSDLFFSTLFFFFGFGFVRLFRRGEPEFCAEEVFPEFASLLCFLSCFFRIRPYQFDFQGIFELSDPAWPDRGILGFQEVCNPDEGCKHQGFILKPRREPDMCSF